jgi:hypothetical protein
MIVIALAGLAGGAFYYVRVVRRRDGGARPSKYGYGVSLEDMVPMDEKDVHEGAVVKTEDGLHQVRGNRGDGDRE